MEENSIKELTRAEEQVMQILWKIKKGFVKEILEKMEEPKPAYTTVSTIVRILQDKGFVSHKEYGRTHQYFPLITKDEYSKAHMGTFIRDYFSNSYQKMMSFFAKEESISLKEMEEIMNLMKKEIENKKSEK
ncbi:MAG TPA: BlaI/MecI/CopY family transcriptional regulator [Bacteroidales bacterium]|nr:BlaI/MecI/CopY family transcriptional regulator [Bacteroidales bacterium]HPT22763.1 BlaI/MecI/CopY family transcriptional regulator [Bacteroidales bacterium]